MANSDESTQFNGGGTFFTISAAYALLSAVSLIQLKRVQSRAPHIGWSTQKVFLLMSFLANGVHAATFGFHMFVFVLKPHVLTLMLLDIPGLLFFSTYTLLVSFWAEIYYQAKSRPTEHLRSWYISINCVIYAIQVIIWISLWQYNNSLVGSMRQVFIAVASSIVAFGFLLFGGRLTLMLMRFPVESKGRQNKIYEVRSITVICVASFLTRCITAAMSAFKADASLKVPNHSTRDMLYYLLVEILPCAIVLFILRKLPPRKLV